MQHQTKNFTTTLVSSKTPHEVFEDILNVRKWWSGFYSEDIDGESRKLNDEFDFRAAEGAHYSRQKLVELVPDKKVAWLVTDSKLTFIEKTDEWIGTRLIFELSERDGRTEVVFTHEGLTPEVECYEICAPSWSRYLEDKLLTLR